MKAKRIFLIRHGQSLSNADPDAHATIPDWKIPLTDLGRVQSAIAGKAITLSIVNAGLGVYVSPYRRTRETWDCMKAAMTDPCQYDIRWVKEDPRLREQEWGHLRTAEQSDAIDAERQSYGPFFYRIPDGESGADVYDRCTGFLDTLYRDFEKPDFPSHVLIVTHGFTMRVLLMRWLHWSIEEFHLLQNSKNCQIAELQLCLNDRYRLVGHWPKREEIS